MRTRMLRRVVPVVALALAALLSGCGFACTAVGYSATLIVAVVGDRAGEVVRVQVCSLEGCTVTPEEFEARTDAPLCVAPVPAPLGLDVPKSSEAGADRSGDEVEPAPTLPVCSDDPSGFGEVSDLGVLERGADGSWSTEFLTGTGPFVVSGYDAEGALVADAEVEDFDWVRTGGSARCGGPVRATFELEAS